MSNWVLPPFIHCSVVRIVFCNKMINSTKSQLPLWCRWNCLTNQLWIRIEWLLICLIFPRIAGSGRVQRLTPRFKFSPVLFCFRRRYHRKWLQITVVVIMGAKFIRIKWRIVEWIWISIFKVISPFSLGYWQHRTRVQQTSKWNWKSRWREPDGTPRTYNYIPNKGVNVLIRGDSLLLDNSWSGWRYWSDAEVNQNLRQNGSASFTVQRGDRMFNKNKVLVCTCISSKQQRRLLQANL